MLYKPLRAGRRVPYTRQRLLSLSYPIVRRDATGRYRLKSLNAPGQNPIRRTAIGRLTIFTLLNISKVGVLLLSDTQATVVSRN